MYKKYLKKYLFMVVLCFTLIACDSISDDQDEKLSERDRPMMGGADEEMMEMMRDRERREFDERDREMREMDMMRDREMREMDMMMEKERMEMDKVRRNEDKEFQKETGLDFDYDLKVMFVKGLDRIMRDGGAYKGGFDNKDTWTPPKIELEFAVDPYNFPNDFEEISAQISDVLRHEKEHLTQSGGNDKGKDFKASMQDMNDDRELVYMEGEENFTDDDKDVLRYFDLDLDL